MPETDSSQVDLNTPAVAVKGKAKDVIITLIILLIAGAGYAAYDLYKNGVFDNFIDVEKNAFELQ
ncbi:MAG: hypothetical protein AAGB12_16765, partial [Pseudomonadota bacterium]